MIIPASAVRAGIIGVTSGDGIDNFETTLFELSEFAAGASFSGNTFVLQCPHKIAFTSISDNFGTDLHAS